VETKKPQLVTFVEILSRLACVFALIVVKELRVNVVYMMLQLEGASRSWSILPSNLTVNSFKFFLLQKAYSKAIKEGK
jgi:hypothetical protein